MIQNYAIHQITKQSLELIWQLIVISRISKLENEKQDFFQLVLWGNQAENFSNWIKKGNLVGVVGELRSRTYENQQGQRIFVTEVLVSYFWALEPRSSNGNNNQQSQGGYGNNMPPVDNNDYGYEPNAAMNSPMDISDDDLPF